MTAIYGHKWASAYGETDADDTWARGLHDVSPQQLAAGLHACLWRTDPWPPTLPEFISMCKPEPKPACHDSFIALPKPTLTAEQKAEVSRKLRAALKGNTESPDPQEAAL